MEEPEGDLLGSSSSFFGGPTSSSAEPLSALARRRPGKLFELGLKCVKEDLAALQGQRSDPATAEQMR